MPNDTGAYLTDLKRIFGAAVKRRRMNIGLSQREMAAQHGLSQNLVSAVENGKTNVTLSMMARLATAVDGEVHEMLTNKNTVPDGLR